MRFNLVGATITCHSYRTARVFGAFLDFDRGSDEAKEIEATLISKAGVSPDNHVVYTITPKDGSAPLHVWCTDNLMRVGTKLQEENW